MNNKIIIYLLLLLPAFAFASFNVLVDQPTEPDFNLLDPALIPLKQSFKLPIDSDISQINLVFKNVIPTTSTYWLNIASSSGEILATSTVVNNSSIPPYFAYMIFPFDSSPVFNAGQTYWIVINKSLAVNDLYYKENVSNPYPDGNEWQAIAGNAPLNDMTFTIYGSGIIPLSLNFIYPNASTYNAIAPLDKMVIQATTDIGEWYKLNLTNIFSDFGSGREYKRDYSSLTFLATSSNNFLLLPINTYYYNPFSTNANRVYSLAQMYRLDNLTGTETRQELFWFLVFNATGTTVVLNSSTTFATTSNPAIKPEYSAPGQEIVSTSTPSLVAQFCDWDGWFASSTMSNVYCYTTNFLNDSIHSIQESIKNQFIKAGYALVKNIFPISAFYHYNSLLDNLATTTPQEIEFSSSHFNGGKNIQLISSSTMSTIESKVGFSIRGFFDKLLYLFAGLIILIESWLLIKRIFK